MGREQANDKSDRILEGVAYWGSFYRCNPHRFVEEYLNIKLKLFQKFLIFAMMHNYFFMYIASRGQGKSFLCAIYMVVRCILYPKTQIVVASATRSQANETLLKITEILMRNYEWGSENLKREIENYSIGQNRAFIKFRNGSIIKVATASDTGRGLRGNILVVDEFRMVDKDTIDTVLKRFLTAPRQPNYLNNPKYKHLLERNTEIYLSSAWYQNHWSFKKAKSFYKNMLDDRRKYFICSLSYQIALLEGLLSREAIEDEMSEDDFDEIKWSMEMESLFYGDTDGSFFAFEDIASRRGLESAIYPRNKLSSRNSKLYKIPDLMLNERRILSVDVALMASKGKKKNDASSIMINRAIPNSKNSYGANFVYIDSVEGVKTEELALIIRRLYEEYKCTDLVIDANGIGLGVCDMLMTNLYDYSNGKTYKALTCCNDKDMAERCTVSDAIPTMWCIKANQTFNTEMCVLLRNGFIGGKINLLLDDINSEAFLKKNIKDYNKLSVSEQMELKLPYIQTTLLVYELVKLQSEVVGTNIKIREISGMRKDRYSSIGMNYWVQCQLERGLQKKKDNSYSGMSEYAKAIRKFCKKPKMY